MGLAAQIAALPWGPVPRPSHVALARIGTDVGAWVNSPVLHVFAHETDPEAVLKRALDAYVGVAFDLPWNDSRRQQFRGSSLPVTLVDRLAAIVADDSATPDAAMASWHSRQLDWDNTPVCGALVEIRDRDVELGVELGGVVSQVQRLNANPVGVVLIAKAATVGAGLTRLARAEATLPSGVPKVSLVLVPGARVVLVPESVSV